MSSHGGDLGSRPDARCACMWADGFRIAARDSCQVHAPRPEPATAPLRIEATARGVVADLLAALPPIGHACFRPQGCVSCGRSKERDDVRALLARRLDALGGE